MAFRISAKAEILLDDDRKPVGMSKDWETAACGVSYLEADVPRVSYHSQWGWGGHNEPSPPPDGWVEDVEDAQDILLKMMAESQMSPIQRPDPNPYDEAKNEATLLIHDVMDE